MFYRKIIPYLKNNTNYDTNLILENLKRTNDILNLKKITIFQLFWWNFLARFSIRRKEKYKQRLKNVISKQELIALFEKGENG